MLRKMALALTLSTMAACGDDTRAEGGGGAGSDQGGDTNQGGAGSCQVVFRQLQKDAYRETAGRSGSFWPPHTTTTLTYSCGDDETTVVMANHGTLPDAKDVNGDIILQEITSQSFEGTRDQVDALVAQYQACQCDGVTEFLSLDSLGDEAVQALVTNLINYIQVHLTCSDPGGVALVVQNLQNGEIEPVLETLPSCTFTDGALEEGLNEALATFLAESQALLDDYHVCNNDAVLQAGLIDTFNTTGEATACDAASATCHGPLWFYDPSN